MELNNIVPWGRSFKEYQAMFSLSAEDLGSRILGCGDGPASFNAELTKVGGSIVSLDPIYQFSREQIHSRIDRIYPEVLSQVAKNRDDFIWDSIANVDELGRVRMQAMESFLNDYEQGKMSGRYKEGQLPVLPFNNAEFDLALCSHYLFLYSNHVDQAQHFESIKELCRVAHEVRIYPLLALDGKKSKHLESVINLLKTNGLDVSLQAVNYQFQKGATEMLVIKNVHS